VLDGKRVREIKSTLGYLPRHWVTGSITLCNNGTKRLTVIVQIMWSITAGDGVKLFYWLVFSSATGFVGTGLANQTFRHLASFGRYAVLLNGCGRG
jgi:hypothetical protein